MPQRVEQAPDQGGFAGAKLPFKVQNQSLGGTGSQGFAQPQRCGLIGQTKRL